MFKSVDLRCISCVNLMCSVSFKDGCFLQQKPDILTTAAGHPAGDKLNLLTVGPRGPLLVQDVVFTDEMAHFDRERIPERVVHAKGGGECLFNTAVSPALAVANRVQVTLFLHVGRLCSQWRVRLSSPQNTTIYTQKQDGHDDKRTQSHNAVF